MVNSGSQPALLGGSGLVHFRPLFISARIGLKLNNSLCLLALKAKLFEALRLLPKA